MYAPLTRRNIKLDNAIKAHGPQLSPGRSSPCPRGYLRLEFGVSLSRIAVVPNLFGTRDRFHGRQFFHGPGVCVGGFRMIQAHYIYWALYFYYYYIVIYNEIIIQLTIMQNQWEP